MVNFAELKAKAEKAKDAGVTRVVNTKDRYSSIPSSKTTWDPNWKHGAPGSSSTPSPPPPPPPPPSEPPRRLNVDASSPSALPSRLHSSPMPAVSLGPPPVVQRASRPDLASMPASDVSKLPPPPKRFSSGYPSSHKRAESEHAGVAGASDRVDWLNLSSEDKEEFFRWLDEFFSRYFNVELGTEKALSSLEQPQVPVPVGRTGPPPINSATRPRGF
ncbi:hypothetical protein ID866_10339 [Astraeus odoratus]|nr:hypothetical protein ID866_10339 [Astraeus odoratus]